MYPASVFRHRGFPSVMCEGAFTIIAYTVSRISPQDSQLLIGRMDAGRSCAIGSAAYAELTT